MERPLKILAVDDEQIVLDSIRKHLRGDNYSLESVLSVQEALTFLGREPFDIVLTDLIMPEIDGLEFIRDLSIRHSAITIIIITGYASITTALKAKQMGAFDYIAKPFSRHELLEVVGRAEEIIRSTPPDNEPICSPAYLPMDKFQSIGHRTWSKLENDGTLTIGLKRAVSYEIDQVHSILLPSVGDKLRQGTECLQVFSLSMRSYVIASPFSGTVVAINQLVVENPELILQDPQESGWLYKIRPSNYDKEIMLLGR